MTDRFRFDTHVAIAQCAALHIHAVATIASRTALRKHRIRIRFKRADVHSHGDRLHGAV